MDILSNWLQKNGCYAKNFGQEFSNAVLVARLIKRIDPRLVDLHNYPAIHNTPEKLSNWSTLNDKVLKKVGLTLGTDTILKLAMGDSEAIIWLLTNLMQKALYRSAPVDATDTNGDFRKPISKLGVYNKMYKEVLSSVSTKIQELEGSLRTIDDIYSKNINKCYLDVLKKDYLYNNGKLTKGNIETSNMLGKSKKPKTKLSKLRTIKNNKVKI